MFAPQHNPPSASIPVSQLASSQWKPTERQTEFLSLPDEIFEAFYGGAAGGAKTETLIMLPIVRKFFEHPRFKMLYLRRTYPELDSEVIPRSQLYYKHAGFNSYQDQKKRWTHPSGAIIQFGHCEHEKDVAKYDTSEYNVICFDESTSFTEYQYTYLAMSRCRSSAANLPAIVRSASNPGNISHGFFRKRFVEPAKDGRVILKETRDFHGQKTTLLRIYIPSRVQDNPHLLKNDPNYIARLNSLPEAERAAKLYGDWWTFSGQAFSEFRIAPFPDEPKHAKHVIEPFEIPYYWPRVRSIDWGFNALSVCGWYAINPNPTKQQPAKVIKYREADWRKTNISVWSEQIQSLSGQELFADNVLDPSAWGHRGDEFTIAEQVQNAGLSVRKADNDRISGKILIHEMLRWQLKQQIQLTKDQFDQELWYKLYRTNPIKAREYEDLFTAPSKEEILPKFQIFNTCPNTIKHIQLCVSDKDHPEDVAELSNDTDDYYDETRYGLKACQNYLDGGQKELAHETEVAKTLEFGARNPSMSGQTLFQMKMRKLFDANKDSESGIRRFHRGKLRGANW